MIRASNWGSSRAKSSNCLVLPLPQAYDNCSHLNVTAVGMTSLRNEKPPGRGHLVIDYIHAICLNDLLKYVPCMTSWIFVRRGYSDCRTHCTEVVRRGLMDQTPPHPPTAATCLHPMPSSVFLSKLPAILSPRMSAVWNPYKLRG